MAGHHLRRFHSMAAEADYSNYCHCHHAHDAIVHVPMAVPYGDVDPYPVVHLASPASAKVTERQGGEDILHDQEAQVQNSLQADERKAACG